MYDMHIQVPCQSLQEARKVFAVLQDEWPTEEETPKFFDSTLFQYGGEGRLCGGEGEDEFAERVALAVWKKLGRYTEVRVTATYLEDLPYESYCMDEADYQRLMVSTPKEEEAPY